MNVEVKLFLHLELFSFTILKCLFSKLNLILFLIYDTYPRFCIILYEYHREAYIESQYFQDFENFNNQKPICGCSLKLCRTSETPRTVAHQDPCPWGFPSKNIEVGFHPLLLKP